MWQITYAKAAAKKLENLPLAVQTEIKAFLQAHRWVHMPNRVVGRQGLSAFWPVRVGDYMVLCYIKSRVDVVEVLNINYEPYPFK